MFRLILEESDEYACSQTMCIMWNEPTPPSGFPRSLMSYVQYANDLGNPLGCVGSFHMIIESYLIGLGCNYQNNIFTVSSEIFLNMFLTEPNNVQD